MVAESMVVTLKIAVSAAAQSLALLRAVGAPGCLVCAVEVFALTPPSDLPRGGAGGQVQPRVVN